MQFTSALTGFHDHADTLTGVASVIGELAEVADSLGLEHHTGELRALAERAAQDTIRIVITGDFKAGKSTLVNALLGASVSPVAPHPGNPVLLTFTNGPGHEVAVWRDDGTVQPLDPRQLPAVVTRAERDPAPYRTIQVRLPSAVLANRIELVDTPSLPGDSFASRERLDHLLRGDVTVFVKNALAPITESEAAWLDRMRGGELADRVLVVVNRIDQVSPDEVDSMRQDIADHLPGSPVFPLTALNAQHWRADGDAERVAESGITAFEDALAHHLAEHATPVHARAFADAATHHLDALTAFLDARTEEAMARGESATRRLIELDREADAALAELDREIADLTDRFAARAAEQVVMLSTRLPEWAAEYSGQSARIIGPVAGLIGVNSLRTPPQVTAAAREIIGYLEGRFADTFAQWLHTELVPATRAEIEELGLRYVTRSAVVRLTGSMRAGNSVELDLGSEAAVAEHAARAGARQTISRMLAGAALVGPPAGLLTAVVGAGVLSAWWFKKDREFRKRVVQELSAALRDRAGSLGDDLAVPLREQLRDFLAAVRERYTDAREVMAALVSDSREVSSTEHIRERLRGLRTLLAEPVQ